MSDLTPTKGLKFDDIVRRQQTEGTSRYWHEARKIMTNEKYRGQFTHQADFWVTPSIESNGMTFALARMAATEQPLLIVNGDYDSPVEITRAGAAALVMYSTNEPVDEDIESILRRIDSTMAERADYRKRQAKELAQKAKDTISIKWQKFLDWYRSNRKDIWGWAGVASIPVGFVLVIVLIGIAAASCGGSDPGAETKAFDSAHPGLILKGQRVSIGPTVVLKTIGADYSLNVPHQPSQNVDEFPRSYTVVTGTCPANPSDDIPLSSYTDNGRINGDEYILIESNAPSGVVRAQVDPVGDVLLCATDPMKQGMSNGPRYEVLMQVQTVKP